MNQTSVSSAQLHFRQTRQSPLRYNYNITGETEHSEQTSSISSSEVHISIFPIELLIEIFSDLCLLDQISVLQTCKLWNSIILSSPSLARSRYLPLSTKDSIPYLHRLIDPAGFFRVEFDAKLILPAKCKIGCIEDYGTDRDRAWSLEKVPPRTWRYLEVDDSILSEPLFWPGLSTDKEKDAAASAEKRSIVVEATKGDGKGNRGFRTKYTICDSRIPESLTRSHGLFHSWGVRPTRVKYSLVVDFAVEWKLNLRSFIDRVVQDAVFVLQESMYTVQLRSPNVANVDPPRWYELRFMHNFRDGRMNIWIYDIEYIKGFENLKGATVDLASGNETTSNLAEDILFRQETQI
ncbi:hypothetical protein H072_9290 [Dactylellina haptotyla CBS 200.50]|uniref:F-box domain-containing protein n=1 Tax=Dactylellina haptotyla (strain CBS 200.50) TaxID=1284197 RepID=S8A2V7_DACHA|nr:hypothetical protein H072_9290 [Dactylellina haptotyla CBS 200.50]